MQRRANIEPTRVQKLDCIILVDDDDVANYVHESLIEDADIANQVLTAENGREALALITEQASQPDSCPSLIFLDINMPVMNGFGFLEAYRRLEDELPQPVIIVMLTSSLNPDDLERARRAGASDFLDKPLTSDKLREVVDKHF